MKRERWDYEFWFGLICIILQLMLMKQCMGFDDIDRDLRDIKHDIHMLRYK